MVSWTRDGRHWTASIALCAEARAVDAQTNVDLFAGELLASAEQVGAAERLESEAKATLDQVRAELTKPRAR